jgi:hypothetical protein
LEFEQAQGMQEYFDSADGNQQKCDSKWKLISDGNRCEIYLQASDTYKQENDSLRLGRLGAAGQIVTRNLVSNKRDRTRRRAIEADVATALYIAYRRTRCFIG